MDDALQYEEYGNFHHTKLPAIWYMYIDVPNAGDGLKRLSYKQDWDVDLREYMKKLDLKKPVILCGDLNVAHKDIGMLN